MLAKLLSLFLKASPAKPKRVIVEPVFCRTDYPELRYIQREKLEKMNKEMKDLEMFCTIVQVLNEGLEDDRLTSTAGTLQALKQLRDYGILTKRVQNIVINRTTRTPQERMPKLFFEV